MKVKLDEINEWIGDTIENPTELLDDFGQNLNNVYENKGICGAIGSVAGDLFIAKNIDEFSTAAKGLMFDEAGEVKPGAAGGELDAEGNVGEGTLDSKRVKYYLSKSRNNIDSDTVILGSTGKYDVIAENEGYTFFKMSDDVWGALEKETGYNYDEIWKVNQKFIEEQINANKRILLSNDPYKGYYFDDGTKRFYQKELDYLSDNGYTFKSTNDGLWEAIKK